MADRGMVVGRCRRGLPSRRDVAAYVDGNDSAIRPCKRLQTPCLETRLTDRGVVRRHCRWRVAGERDVAAYVDGDDSAVRPCERLQTSCLGIRTADQWLLRRCRYCWVVRRRCRAAQVNHSLDTVLGHCRETASCFTGCSEEDAQRRNAQRSRKQKHIGFG